MLCEKTSMLYENTADSREKLLDSPEKRLDSHKKGLDSRKEALDSREKLLDLRKKPARIRLLRSKRDNRGDDGRYYRRVKDNNTNTYESSYPISVSCGQIDRNSVRRCGPVKKVTMPTDKIL
jgi:hypothetical protein